MANNTTGILHAIQEKQSRDGCDCERDLYWEWLSRDITHDAEDKLRGKEDWVDLRAVTDFVERHAERRRGHGATRCKHRVRVQHWDRQTEEHENGSDDHSGQGKITGVLEDSLWVWDIFELASTQLAATSITGVIGRVIPRATRSGVLVLLMMKVELEGKGKQLEIVVEFDECVRLFCCGGAIILLVMKIKLEGGHGKLFESTSRLEEYCKTGDEESWYRLGLKAVLVSVKRTQRSRTR
ncbi:hypothetical protein BJ741DRAFT_580674 [Chytriomyces cf. hyalinus JEL632]|nr:hypothetical protein BJ741DRAFT_580674 [Chytriomyces cf. hyalinus JEL632]